MKESKEKRVSFCVYSLFIFLNLENFNYYLLQNDGKRV